MVTLLFRYGRGDAFAKPTVIKIGAHRWAVLGPGFPWVGRGYETWDEAIEVALNGR